MKDIKNRPTDRQIYRHTDRFRLTDCQIDLQTDRQNNRRGEVRHMDQDYFKR